MLDSQINLQN